jgi:hypothetical protein
LRSLSGVRTAAAVGRENPILDAVVKESAVIYDKIPLRDYITEEKRAELGRQLFLEINEICNAADPIAQIRPLPGSRHPAAAGGRPEWPARAARHKRAIERAAGADRAKE